MCNKKKTEAEVAEVQLHSRKSLFTCDHCNKRDALVIYN